MAAGSIVIDLLMKTGMFETDTKRAEKALENFRKRAKQVGVAVGAAFAAAGTAVTVMVRNAIREIDQLALMSDQIGITTENLSRMRYAAEQMAGVSNNQFDTALRRMTRRIAEAADGAGPAVAALQALGLEARALARLSPDEQFRKLADAMKRTEGQGARLRATMAIFDTEGMPLVNMLREGADAIREMEEEADRFGITIDGKTKAAARAFGTELTRLTAIKDGLAKRITAAVLPTLLAVTRRLSGSAEAAEALNWAAQVAASGLRIIATAGTLVVGVLRTVGDYLGGLAAAFVALVSGRFRDALTIVRETGSDIVQNLKNTVGNVMAVWNGIHIDPGPIEDPIDDTRKGVQDAGKGIVDEARKIAERIEETIARIRRSIETFGMTDTQVQLFDLRAAGASPEQLERARELLTQLDLLKKKQADNEKATRAATDAQRELAQIYDETRSPIEKLNIELARLARLRAVATSPEQVDALARAEFQAWKDYEEQSKNSLEEMDSFAKNAAENIQRNFGDTLFNAMNGNFKGIGDSFTQMIQRMIAEAAAADLARRMFGGLVDGGSGSGWFGNALSAVGSFFGFGGARAGGGDVLPGRSYLVGEDGPERFVPRTAGTILPSTETRGASRSVSVTNVFHLAQPASRDTQAQVATQAGIGIQRAMLRHA